MIDTISVVTVTHNSERYLDETIQSVVSQRGKFYIEYLVLDNCSTDSTLEILKKNDMEIRGECFRCNCLGVTFRYISEPDNGMYDALSKGMRLCNGDIFAYINSDDFYLPNAFSTIFQVFEDDSIDWLTGLPTFYNSYGAVVPANIPCVYRSRYISSGVYGKHLTHIQQESTFWRRHLYEELDLDRLSSYKLAGDFYIWWVFSQKNRLRTVKAQLSGFRFHSNNKSLDKTSYNDEFDSIAVNNLNILDYIKIYTYKVLFKLLGNKLLKFYPDVIITR